MYCNLLYRPGVTDIEQKCSMFECSFMFSEHSNKRTRIDETNSRTSEHSDSTKQMKTPNI